ncbi:DUF6221 family protein [Nonomuraea sp. MTCD27]|uniref:DUF6221 family protein n=1 Tax=Nonomuraea sp. MTCD27 TaxID=1676747 RepID=UPI0035C182C5
MDDLIAFLRARLNEDEQEALAASPGPWKANAEQHEVLAVDDIEVATGFALNGEQLRATVRHIVRHDPARVLREVEAKRRMLQAHIGYYGLGMDEYWPIPTLTLLALPYANHPDYREEWRPPA